MRHVGYAKRHRMSKTPTWWSWQGIITRCFGNNKRALQYYKKRGITVCKRWHKFEAFLLDMGERPPGTSIDRKNNNGNYEPKNCCWSTPKQQADNRSSTIPQELRNIIKSDFLSSNVSQRVIAEKYKISQGTVSNIIHNRHGSTR